MVQPVVEEMLATVQAAGSSLFGLFSSCTTFDRYEMMSDFLLFAFSMEHGIMDHDDG